MQRSSVAIPTQVFQFQEMLHRCKILTEKFLLLFQRKFMEGLPKHSHSWVCGSVVSLIDSALLKTKIPHFQLAPKSKDWAEPRPDLFQYLTLDLCLIALKGNTGWVMGNGMAQRHGKGSPTMWGRQTLAFRFSANYKCGEQFWSAFSQAELMNRITHSALWVTCWSTDFERI